MPKTRVGIINVTGYAGSELARILSRHPDVEVAQVTGRSAAGKNLSEVYPHLWDVDMVIDPALDESVDLVFSALPHAASAEAMVPFIDDGIPCVDISADFRLRDINTYESWYKTAHPRPDLIEHAVYGLPELHRADIAKSKLVANPGCYPTGTILGMAPALDADIIEPDVISDSKSGVSGSGRSGDVKYNFSELNENMSAYGLSGHRHMPESAQELTAISKRGEVNVTFVPHLAPMTRGILGTHYAKLIDPDIDLQDITEIYKSFYEGEPFVRVADAPPSTKETWGSNNVFLYIALDPGARRLIVVSALDNLGKGAAGSGVQNMNVMLGIPETAGLSKTAVYP